MLCINNKVLVAIFPRESIWKSNRHNKNLATFGQKCFLWIFVFHLLIYVPNKIISTSSSFCVIALQIYREICKKYRKKAITLQLKIIIKRFLDNHMSNVMLKFRSWGLNGVTTIAKTYIIISFAGTIKFIRFLAPKTRQILNYELVTLPLRYPNVHSFLPVSLFGNCGLTSRFVIWVWYFLLWR